MRIQVLPVAALICFALAGPAVAQLADRLPGAPQVGSTFLRPESPRMAEYRAIARRFAKEKGLPYELVDAVMNVESRYNAAARGRDGEVGLMQVMPPTARQLGFGGTLEDLADPETNIRLGVTYLAEAWRLAGQDVCTTVMKYRAGWGETRFSVLSVRYCLRVRDHLAVLNYPVTGTVPEATFGFRRDEYRQGVFTGGKAMALRLHRGQKLRSRASWKAYDARMKDLDRQGKAAMRM